MRPGETGHTDVEVDRAFAELAGELREVMRGWASDPGAWPETRFRELALRTFRLQFRGVLPYRRYCESRGVTPETVGDWTEIPPVPTAAFRAVPLAVGGREAAAAEFRTSGTTRGAGERGLHPVRDLELYRASAEAAFRRFVLEADGLPRLGSARFCVLVPPFGAAPDSSLSWMCDAVSERFGDDGSRHVAGADRVDWDAAVALVEAAGRDGVPVCVLATTLALDEWMRRLAAADRSLEMPPGSRIMDTGGSKGREGLRREDVLERARARLGVHPGAVINELGMTELLSQRYSVPSAAGGPPRLAGPPWLRTRALDPVTLAPLPDGETGVLCHLDLANAGSVCHVLTEDLGRVVEGAVEWRGRATDAPPRGCSLATAELLAAQGEGRR